MAGKKWSKINTIIIIYKSKFKKITGFLNIDENKNTKKLI